jgi:hypothetical protein
VPTGIVVGMTNLFDDESCWEDDEQEFDAPELSLTLEQQAALAAAVQARQRTCDGTLGAAEEWARGAGVPWPPLRRELEHNGGFCDCEVLLNLFGGDFDRSFDAGG